MYLTRKQREYARVRICKKKLIQDTSSSVRQPAGSLHFDVGQVGKRFVCKADDSMTLSSVMHQNIMEVDGNCNNTTQYCYQLNTRQHVLIFPLA